MNNMAENCDTGLSSFRHTNVETRTRLEVEGSHYVVRSLADTGASVRLEKMYTNLGPVQRRKNGKPNRIWKDDLKGSIDHDFEKGERKKREGTKSCLSLSLCRPICF
jgi:hypothetical protein